MTGVSPVAVSRRRGRAASLSVRRTARRAFTIRGVGYGLEEREAFLSQLHGLKEASEAAEGNAPMVVIAEQTAERADRHSEILAEFQASASPTAEPTPRQAPDSATASDPASFGTVRETKPRLFVAMPFDEVYSDEYEIGFVEAAHSAGFIRERLDFEHFTGDIFAEIEHRTRTARCVMALLNDLIPNLFLEIGDALAVRTPVIFAVKAGSPVPFDIRGHRHLEYSSIHGLRRDLSAELAGLSRAGAI